MDLGDQRGVDEPRRLEQALIVPVGILRAQTVADGVVLVREDVMEQAQSEPPVVVETGDLDAVVGQRQPSLPVEEELAVPALTAGPPAHTLLGNQVAAV